MSESRAGCQIRELDVARRSDRARFVELPFRLARTIDVWRPGVRKYHSDLIHPRRNPFWRTRNAWFFVAIREGQVVGRMGVLDVGNIPDRPRAAVMIMPDFIDDPGVIRALVDAVSRRALERGATELVGPMNPNIHHDIGIQVSGFSEPNAIFMGYQPAYYARRLEDYGFEPLAELDAWSLYERDFLRHGRLRDLALRVERNPSLRIRSANLRRFGEELRVFHHLYSASFDGHWGFVPPTWEEFRFIAGDLKLILKQQMVLIAEWDGEPVGFVLGVPDLYDILPRSSHGRLTPAAVLHTLRRWPRLDRVRVMIAGVLPTHRHHGIHLPLFYRIAASIFELGFRGGEIAWVMRENHAMQHVLPLLGARATKAYRVYTRRLEVR